jgi:SAM-dependent methyltransferase
MKLAIVVPFVNDYPLIRAAADSLARHRVLEETEVVALDNGSAERGDISGARTVHLPENIGNYPVFERLPEWISPESDLVAVLHSDLFVHEYGFDRRIVEAFAAHPYLGLLGFVGSNEIDPAGGRGLGTVSNFQGMAIAGRQGTPAEVHGRRMDGLERAAVVDGCAMVFRRSMLAAIRHDPNFPPHHFYDRLLSCQVMELGYMIGVLGIACDHISGQTAGSASYAALARRWCLRHLGMENPANPDLEIYLQAEARWLREYRERKRLVPVRVPTEMPAAATGRKLNLGCDAYRLPGFVNVDLRCEGKVQPEVLADAARLPFADGAFDFIYAGHLLEHLYYDCVPAYLDEWRRVLRSGGTLALVVPDVGTGMRRYAAGAYNLDHVLPQIFGQYYSWDYAPQRHRYAYDYPRLVESVSRVPWTAVARLDFGNAPAAIAPHIGRVISDADWQMGVVLSK